MLFKKDRCKKVTFDIDLLFFPFCERAQQEGHECDLTHSVDDASRAVLRKNTIFLDTSETVEQHMKSQGHSKRDKKSKIQSSYRVHQMDRLESNRLISIPLSCPRQKGYTEHDNVVIKMVTTKNSVPIHNTIYYTDIFLSNVS